MVNRAVTVQSHWGLTAPSAQHIAPTAHLWAIYPLVGGLWRAVVAKLRLTSRIDATPPKMPCSVGFLPLSSRHPPTSPTFCQAALCFLPLDSPGSHSILHYAEDISTA